MDQVGRQRRGEVQEEEEEAFVAEAEWCESQATGRGGRKVWIEEKRGCWEMGGVGIMPVRC